MSIPVHQLVLGLRFVAALALCSYSLPCPSHNYRPPFTICHLRSLISVISQRKLQDARTAYDSNKEGLWKGLAWYKSAGSLLAAQEAEALRLAQVFNHKK